jgi:hypothetical protein
MRKFMGEERLSASGRERVLSCPEDDLRAERVGASTQGRRRLRGCTVGVDAHFAEVVPEALLEAPARSGIKMHALPPLRLGRGCLLRCLCLCVKVSMVKVPSCETIGQITTNVSPGLLAAGWFSISILCSASGDIPDKYRKSANLNRARDPRFDA